MDESAEGHSETTTFVQVALLRYQKGLIMAKYGEDVESGKCVGCGEMIGPDRPGELIELEIFCEECVEHRMDDADMDDLEG